MSTLGERLRAARLARDVTVQQAEFDTRIRAALIEHLEADELDQLPPSPFARGLLRSYARYLGLEPDQVLEQYAIGTGVSFNPLTSPAFPDSYRNFAAPQTAPNAPPSTVPEVPVRRRRRSNRRDGRFVTTEQTFPTRPPGMTQFLPAAAARGRKLIVPAEIMAGLLIAVLVIVLAYTAYTRLFEDAAAQTDSSRAVARIVTISPTPPIPGTRIATPVPTFVSTPGPSRVPGGNPSLIASPTPAAPVVEGASMTLVIEAQQSVWVWVIADNQELVKGNLAPGSRTFAARTRLYFQIKNMYFQNNPTPLATATMNGKKILPAIFAERTLLERAWMTGDKGTPIAVQPDGFIVTPAPQDRTPAP